MIKQVFWLGAGITVGVLVVRKVNQAVQAYSPSNLAGNARESAVGLFDTVRDFVADVRDGMAQREAEIHAAFEEGVMLEEPYGDDVYGDDGADDDGTDGVGHRG